MSNQTIEIEGVRIDRNAPWARWPRPEIHVSKVSNAIVKAIDFGGSKRLCVEGTDGEIGFMSAGGIKELSLYSDYPTTFVEKLPIDLQAQVISERMSKTKAGEMSFTSEPFELVDPVSGDRRMSDRRLVTNVSPGWRGIVPHAAVAQTASDLMKDFFGEAVEVKSCDRYDNVMRMRILATSEEVVTPQLGDILRAGIEIMHQYGVKLSARLYTERLVCLNGMTSNDTRFTWQMGKAGTVQQQLDFLNLAVVSA